MLQRTCVIMNMPNEHPLILYKTYSQKFTTEYVYNVGDTNVLNGMVVTNS